MHDTWIEVCQVWPYTGEMSPALARGAGFEASRLLYFVRRLCTIGTDSGMQLMDG